MERSVPSPAICTSLKDEPSGELELALAADSVDRSEGNGCLSSGGCVEDHVGIDLVEGQVIEGVVSLKAHLERHSFSDKGVWESRQLELKQTRCRCFRDERKSPPICFLNHSVGTINRILMFPFAA